METVPAGGDFAAGGSGDSRDLGRHHTRFRTGVAGAAVLIVAALLGAAVLWPASKGGASAGPLRSAAGFSLPAVSNGAQPAVMAGRPAHPVVLNFFASWCDPCHAELPRLAALDRANAGRLEVIGVDVQDNRDLATQMLAETHVGFAAGYDPDRLVSGRWGVDGLPVTVFITPNGTVADYHRGELSSGELARRAAHLLDRSAPGGQGSR